MGGKELSRCLVKENIDCSVSKAHNLPVVYQANQNDSEISLKWEWPILKRSETVLVRAWRKNKHLCIVDRVINWFTVCKNIMEVFQNTENRSTI